MKIKIISILILFSYQIIFSQNKVWGTYDLDSIVYLEMPFTVYEFDTIIDNNRVYEIYSEDKSSKFIAQKLFFSEHYINSSKSVLPTNAKSLKTFYLDVIDVLNEINTYKLDYGGSIQKNNLEGYRFLHKNNDGKSLHETNMFYINKNLYSFSYFNENGLNEIERKKFFNSIVFNDEYKPIQYPIKRMSYRNKIILGLLGLLLFSYILRSKYKRKHIP